MARFGLTFNLPAPANPADVAQRKLTVVTNGQTPGAEQALAGTATVSQEVEFNQDDTFSVTLKDADASGNWSNASQEFTGSVTDDIAPAAPGEIALASKRQID